MNINSRLKYFFFGEITKYKIILLGICRNQPIILLPLTKRVSVTFTEWYCFYRWVVAEWGGGETQRLI